VKKTVTYLGIDQINYKFSKYDILEALAQKWKIKLDARYEFDLFEGYEDEKPYAELVIWYPKEKEQEEN